MWDFSTEPEFQAHLDWMRDFVREEIWPLETLDLEPEQLDRAMAPLQEQVKERGLWAAHLPPELGGQGFGQVKLGLMHEILGTTPIAPFAFGNQAPDSGNCEILALAGTEEQKERWLHPLLAGDLHSAFSMTEPDTAGSDPTLLQDARGEGRRRLRHHRPQVVLSSNASIADFLIVMAVTDPDARPHQRASMFLVPADTPGVNILRDVPTMEHPQDEFGKYGGHAEILYEDVRIGRRRCSAPRAPASSSPSSACAPAASTTACAGSGSRSARSTCSASARCPARRTARRSAEKQTVQNWIADSAAQMQAARLMTLHAAWVMDTQGATAARKEISLIKFYGAKVLHDVIDRALQIHGWLGYSTDLPLEQMYRFARGGALLRRPRRGAPQTRRAARSCAATSRRPTACRASTSRPGARRRSAGSPTCSRR